MTSRRKELGSPSAAQVPSLGGAHTMRGTHLHRRPPDIAPVPAQVRPGRERATTGLLSVHADVPSLWGAHDRASTPESAPGRLPQSVNSSRNSTRCAQHPGRRDETRPHGLRIASQQNSEARPVQPSSPSQNPLRSAPNTLVRIHSGKTLLVCPRHDIPRTLVEETASGIQRHRTSASSRFRS
jgi:hypothetical protein